MKITQFILSNFKSFKNGKNRIYDANVINFIYGENNSGKSNILKFLKLIFNLKRTTNAIEVEGDVLSKDSLNYFFEGIIDNEPYIFHKNKRDEKIVFKFFIDISNEELKTAGFDFFETLKEEYLDGGGKVAKLKFEGNIRSLDTKSTSEISLDSVSLNGKEVYLKDKKQEKFFNSGHDPMGLLGDKIKFQQLISYLNEITLYIDNDRFFEKEKFQKEVSSLNAQNFKSWLYNFSLDEFRYEEYLSLLEFVRTNKIESLNSLSKLDVSYSIDENNNLDLLLHNGSERLPISSFGTGVSQIFFILAKIFSTRSKVILIEELELNLSPKTQRELFKILRNLINQGQINQVFFTSHSRYFNFRNDFSIYEVSMDANGVSSIQRQNGSVRAGFFNAYKLD
ncbi:AAA family ATPase [Maribacter sp. 2210JD10-5]|uniref:ATP-binding protein n=1 Tax=Maribacter sp. 2210JD10-5 TaxID=3386272 RepID=UPI0039BD8C2A